MIQLVTPDKCTGCGACAYSCPKQCIEMRSDPIKGLLPYINHEICIECGKCQRTCPILNPVELNVPIEAYAARSLSSDESRTSASGGVACTLYRHAIKKGCSIAGAVWNKDYSVTLQTGNTEDWIERFKNSKYVFCDATPLYPELAHLLKQGKKVVIAALPCHISAIRKIFKNDPNLLLIDIVCHGTTPTHFLQQHIDFIEKYFNKKNLKVSFRDPRYNTYTFTFTLSEDTGKCIYAKRTKDGDSYQYGYHRAISYRMNCYQCPFATNRRIGDISLADYPGLGRNIKFPYEKKHINCVLINTEKGKKWFDELVSNNLIEAYERPIDEAVQGNGQLRCPVSKSEGRLCFEKAIISNGGDFEKTMKPIMMKGLRKERIKEISSPRHMIRKIIRTLIFFEK